MNDDHVKSASSPAACPDFDALSRFVDGELRALDMDEVREHLQSCTPCAQLAKRLHGTPDWRASAGKSDRPTAACTPREELLLYVSDGMPAAERRSLEAHLGGCDSCVAEVSRLHHRLGVMQDVEVHVPMAIRERAQAVLAPALHDLAAERGAAHRRHVSVSRSRSVWRRRLRAMLEVPVLVPTAMAAGALFMVVLQETSVQRGQSFERVRAVSVEQRVRVTAASAPVRAKPNLQGGQIATLARGTLVSVTETAEDQHWLLVDLPEGGTGWVERRAFE